MARNESGLTRASGQCRWRITEKVESAELGDEFVVEKGKKGGHISSLDIGGTGWCHHGDWTPLCRGLKAA